MVVGAASQCQEDYISSRDMKRDRWMGDVEKKRLIDYVEILLLYYIYKALTLLFFFEWRRQLSTGLPWTKASGTEASSSYRASK